VETLEGVFAEFLEAQKKRLQPRTYNGYRDIIELFGYYLDDYGYSSLSTEDKRLLAESEGQSFCGLFGIDKLSAGRINEFLDYFLIRKVAGSKQLMKNAGVVMRRLVRWLKENAYIDEQGAARMAKTVAGLKDDLPKVHELAELLWEEAEANPFSQFEEYEEGHFLIDKIEQGRLWLEDFYTEDRLIGPIIVSKRISKAAKKGWTLGLKIGRMMDKWYIIESGNVYP